MQSRVFCSTLGPLNVVLTERHRLKYTGVERDVWLVGDGVRGGGLRERKELLLPVHSEFRVPSVGGVFPAGEGL